ncbi:MAG: prolipoprotein diacylglyceryl transferase [Polyangiaceae bacterium]|nr:prolipoprotein diacylglyceryl transferase [Polyangiaceae bacterium]
MHPILFRIPIPHADVPLMWLLLVAAAIALVVAFFQFRAQSKGGAIIAGVAALALAAYAFKMQGKTFAIGPLPIYSYGVMLGLSLVVGWYLTLGLAERDGLPKEVMANNYVVTAVAAVAGSRILYILTNLDEFDSLPAMMDVRKGGLVAYGGFIGGFLGSLFYLRRYNLPLLPWADVAVPSLASGLMITRIGCYLFGCDFGHQLPKDAPAFLQKLGTFPRWDTGLIDASGGGPSGSPAWLQHLKKHLISDDATASLPVHPTQLYESLVGASLLALLLISRRYQKFRGQIFLIFTFAYGICRFSLEMLRADDERGWIPPSLPEHVLMPLSFILFAIGYIIGPSKMIENPTIRSVTRVLGFIPAIVVFFALKPESFGTSVTVQLSTSQAVALSTGVAACMAFSVYYQAALAHPAAAMAIVLPPSLLAGEAAVAEAAVVSKVADEDDDDASEAKPKKKAADDSEAAPRKKKKKTRKPAESKDVGAQTGETAEAAPKKKKSTEERTSNPPEAEES